MWVGWRLVAGGLLLSCNSRPSPTPAPVVSASPSSTASGLQAHPIAVPFCNKFHLGPNHSDYLAAECGGRAVALWLATREDPQRHRAPRALYLLAEALSFRVVPRTEAREFSLKELLESATDEPTRRWLATEPALKPNGTISAALVDLPGTTQSRATRWSQEEQRWNRLIETSGELNPEQKEQARDWVEVQVLDYLSGAILRRAVEQDERGRLWLIDNRETFLEHPEQYAVDQLLGRLKRCRQWPSGLRDALARLSEEEMDRRFRSGDYEQWLVHRRALRELAIRRRALATWLTSIDQRGP